MSNISRISINVSKALSNPARRGVNNQTAKGLATISVKKPYQEFLKGEGLLASHLSKPHNADALNKFKDSYYAGNPILHDVFRPVTSLGIKGNEQKAFTVIDPGFGREHKIATVSREELDAVIQSALTVQTKLQEMSITDRIKLGHKILDTLVDDYENGKHGAKIATLIGLEVAWASKSPDEVDVSMRELIDVLRGELKQWELLSNIPELAIVSRGLTAIKSPSNFSMLPFRQTVNLLVSGSSSIVFGNEKIPGVEDGRTNFLRSVLPDELKDAVQCVYPENYDDAAHGISQCEQLIGTGSPTAARIIRGNSERLITSYETGGRFNLIILTEKFCNQNPKYFQVAIDQIAPTMTYANGQQCTSLGHLAIVGSEEFRNKVITALKEKLESMPMARTSFETGYAPVTGKPPYNPEDEGGRYIVAPKAVEDAPKGVHHYSPGMALLNLSHPDSDKWHVERWASMFNVGDEYESVSDALRYPKGANSLSLAILGTPDEFSKVAGAKKVRGPACGNCMAAVPPTENFGGMNVHGTNTGTERGGVGAEAPYNYADIELNVTDEAYPQALFSETVDALADLNDRNPAIYKPEGGSRIVAQGLRRHSAEHASVYRVTPDNNLDHVQAQLKVIRTLDPKSNLIVSVAPEVTIDMSILGSNWQLLTQSEDEFLQYAQSNGARDYAFQDSGSVSASFKKYITTTDSGVMFLRKANAGSLAFTTAMLGHIKCLTQLVEDNPTYIDVLISPKNDWVWPHGKDFIEYSKKVKTDLNQRFPGLINYSDKLY